ncbi:hypothetical protein HB13667_10240 [Pseudomonas putida]|uniref:Uncharacterized protein n=1 Tax=Pseudomonas putida TaxID=303 RepID=A0A0P7D7G4_PSEPU|nr:hypothetical protein HB13667_10240 [Pseudomonas putida]
MLGLLLYAHHATIIHPWQIGNGQSRIDSLQCIYCGTAQVLQWGCEVLATTFSGPVRSSAARAALDLTGAKRIEASQWLTTRQPLRSLATSRFFGQAEAKTGTRYKPRLPPQL